MSETNSPCGCDESKEWRRRALEAERTLMRVRATIQRVRPELLRLLDESDADRQSGRTTELLLEAKAWKALNPGAVALVVCTHEQCAQYIRALATHLGADVVVTCPTRALDVVRGRIFRAFFDHSLSTHRALGSLADIAVALQERSLP
jgi:hypothetical protein